MDNKAVELSLEAIKAKPFITDIERDILDTWKDYKSNPFDRFKAQNRVLNNIAKYPDIDITIKALPDTVIKQISEITEEDIKYNMFNQIKCLLLKDKPDLRL